MGSQVGVVTFGEAVRYPDTLITCVRPLPTDYLMPGDDLSLLPELGLAVPVAEFYEDVDLSEASARDQPPR